MGSLGPTELLVIGVVLLVLLAVVVGVVAAVVLAARGRGR